MRYQHLAFFDKTGNSLDFSYDSEKEIWSGIVFIPKVSVDLFEVSQIYILEQMFNTNEQLVYAFPHDLDSADSASEGWIVEWEKETPKEIFLFSYDVEQEKPQIQIVDFATVSLDYDPNQFTDSSGFLHTDLTNNSALQINVALSSSTENIFVRNIYIKDRSQGYTVAEIIFYGETEGEDERLKVLTENMGYPILPADSTIFRNTDINESAIDFIEINRKRKEIMLEGHNIFPYTGSYKALINAIKFYGYENIYMKEYWQDLDPNSRRFGKFIQTNPIQLLQPTASFSDPNIRVPSKSLRKTGKFGLFYAINEIVPNEYDEYDLPVTREEFTYTLEEALIKLYGLKIKLQKYYLPLNARIVDITGEADFFSKNSITTQIEKNQTFSILAGFDTNFEVLPHTVVFLDDLRTIEDLEFPKYTPYDIPQNIVVGPLGDPIVVGTTDIGGPYFIGANSFLSVQDKNNPLGPPVDGKDYTLGELADVFLAYFSRYAPGISTIQQLPDNESVPVGAPIVLKNTSFSRTTFDSINSNWNQLDTISGSIIFSWFYIEYRNSAEIEWTISKNADSVSPEYYNVIRGAIEEYDEVAVILPFVGDYYVEMRIFDFYNNISSTVKQTAVSVRPRNVDFCGYYVERKGDYSWSSESTYKLGDYASYWNLPLEPNTGINEYLMSFDSLDRANFATNNFLNIKNSEVSTYQDSGEESFAGPYFWNYLTAGNWEKTSHLWWDSTEVTGDTPAFFEILEIPSTPLIFNIANSQGSFELYVDTDVQNLSNFADYLNSVTEDPFSRYIYNLVSNEDRTIQYIQAVSKYNSSSGDFISVSGYEVNSPSVEIIIGRTEQSNITNPTWNTANPIYDAKILPILTYVTFTYDNCEIKGKIDEKTTWSLKNKGNSNFSDIYLNSKYFTYMFDIPGNYTLGLSIEDNNKNKYTREKNILVIK